jgi:hypothetical protein
MILSVNSDHFLKHLQLVEFGMVNSGVLFWSSVRLFLVRFASDLNSPEWVTGPEQVKSSGRITTFILCFGMKFPQFLIKQLYRCDSVVIASFVGTGYTTRRWGWLLGRFVNFDGVRLRLLTAATNRYTSIVHLPYDIWVWRTTVEWYWQGKTEELGEKPVPVPLCPPQIPHGLMTVG